MTSEIQETIAEIRALINSMRPILSRLEVAPDDKSARAEMLAGMELLQPLLKKLEEHINVMEKKNGVD